MSSYLEQLLDRFAKEGRPNLKKSVSIVWICYENLKANSGVGAGWLEQKTFYPASIVKLIYACAIEDWLKKDLLVDSSELRRALLSMIRNSSNDATSLIVDLLTGTCSGPSLQGEAWDLWQKQRNLVNQWLATFQWPEFADINCCQKTWSDGPFGRDKDFYGLRKHNRNALTPLAIARLMEAIMTNEYLSPQVCKRLRELMKRSLDLLERKSDPENQIDGFLGEGLPKGTEIWSKAGLMSEVRHDIAWFQVPKRKPMLLVVFSEGRNYSTDNFLLPAFASELSKWNLNK